MQNFISRFLTIAAVLAVSAFPAHAQSLVTEGPSSNMEPCNQQTPVEKAQCLSAELTDPNSLGLSAWKVTNECTERGAVVAKIDFNEGSNPNATADQTVRLTSSNGTVKSKSVGAFSGVYCCNDSSDLCSHLELCISDFNKSSAGETCIFDDTKYAANGNACTISTFCKKSSAGYNLNTITVHWANAKDLKNCDGRLTLHNC